MKQYYILLKKWIISSLTLLLAFFSQNNEINAQCATLLNAGGYQEVCEGGSVTITAEMDADFDDYDFTWYANGVEIPGEGGVGDRKLENYIPASDVTITVTAINVDPIWSSTCNQINLQDQVRIFVRACGTFTPCVVIDNFEEPGIPENVSVDSGGPFFDTETVAGSGNSGIYGNYRTLNIWYDFGDFGSRADILQDSDEFLPSPPYPPGIANEFFGEWFFSSSNDEGNESFSEIIWDSNGAGLNMTELCGLDSDPRAAFRLYDYIADQSGVIMTLTLTDNLGNEAITQKDMPGNSFGSYDAEFALIDFTADPGFNWCEIDKISLYMDTKAVSVDFKFRQFDFCYSDEVALTDDNRALCLDDCISLDTLFNHDVPTSNIPAENILWEDENGNPLDFNDEVCFDAPGTYNYQVTVVDELGCSCVLFQTFEVSDTAVIMLSGKSICLGESVELDPVITGGNGPLSYQWSPGAGLSCTDCPNPIASPTTTTTYTLIVGTSETGDNGGVDLDACYSTSPGITVTVFDLPSVEIEGELVICAGTGNTQLCAVSPDNVVSYEWSHGPFTDCVDVEDGTYTITITDENGCTAEATVEVVDVPSPSVSVDAPATVCAGTPVLITADVTSGTPDYEYLWSNGETTQSVTIFPQSPSSSYSVTVTDANGCTASTSVTAPATPNTVEGNVQVFPDICGKGLGTALASATGGAGGFTYEWSTGDSGPSLTGLIAGTYTVTITDASGCLDIVDAVITEVPGPDVSIEGNQPLCLSESVTLTANISSGTPPYEIFWIPGGATTESITVAPSATSSYTVQVTDANDCVEEATVEVVVNPNPVLTVVPSDPEICFGSDVVLVAEATGGTSNYQYTWSPATGLSCTSCPNPTASPITNITYTVFVEDENGCTDQTTVDVVVNPNPEVTLVSKVDEDCNQENGSITVSPSGGTPNYSFEWNTVPAQYTATATGLGAGTYTVTVTDSKGCTANLTETINNLGGPTVTIDGQSLNCIGENVTLTANPLPLPGNYTYEWSDGLGTSQSVIIFGVSSTKTYFVTVTDEDTNCEATASFTVTVEGCPEITHEKQFLNVIYTGLNSYEVSYQITVENIGTGTGEYTLLDSLAFDNDVVVNSVSVTSDVPGNTGPFVPNQDIEGRYELALGENITAGDPHVYSVTVAIYLDLENPPAGGDGNYDPCQELDPGNYVPENGLYNLSILDTPDDFNDERDEACGELPVISHVKSDPVITQTGPRNWEVSYDITVSNNGYASGTYNLSDTPGFDDDVEYSGATYLTDAPGNAGNPGPVSLVGQGPWNIASDQSIAAGPSTEHVYTITFNVSMDLEDPVSPGDEIYTYCGSAINLSNPSPNEGLYNQSGLDLNDDGTADETKEVCGDLPYIVHEKTSVSPTQLGPNAYEVVYTVEVTNLGGAEGYYDLEDFPGFDDDFQILSAEYVTDASGNAGNPGPQTLAGSGPWSLADDQLIAAGPNTIQTYTITVLVNIDLSEADPVGDNNYSSCGSAQGGNDPQSGEGLYNQSRLDVNNDGVDDEISETCEDIPYNEHEKTLVFVQQNPDDTYNVQYAITVANRGTVASSYGLFDFPDFDSDIVILDAEYFSTVHPLTTLPVIGPGVAPVGGWQLADNEDLPGQTTHIYTLTLTVEMDLNDPNTPGDGSYSECGQTLGISDPSPGEGLYNQSGLDIDNDGTADLFDEDCGDLPYVTHEKSFISAIYNPVTGTYDVTFDIDVWNNGGATGYYDLYDEIGFDDDVLVENASYTCTAPGHPANGSPVILAGTSWTIADDQEILAGAQHTYVFSFEVSIDLGDPASIGDEVYDPCGSTSGNGEPTFGEGLYNQSSLDRSNDGTIEEDRDDCGDIEVVDLALRKQLTTAPPYSYGQILNFDIEVFNQGNIEMTDVVINDYLPNGFSFSPADNVGAWSTAGPGLLEYNSIASIPVGGSISLNLVLRFEQSSGPDAWTNYAEIASMKDVTGQDRSGEDIDSSPNSDTPTENAVKPGDTDDDNINGGGPLANEDEDDHDPAGIDFMDLALIKQTALGGPYTYGQSVPFEITVINQGNMPAHDIKIFDYLSDGFGFDAILNFPLAWLYSGNPANIAQITVAEDAPLLPGESLTITIYQIIQDVPSSDPSNWTNYAEIDEIRDENGDKSNDVDSTPDGNVLNDAGGEPDGPNDDRTDGVGIEDEDDHDPARIELFDLALEKQLLSNGPFSYGDVLDFSITVYNQGNEPATDILVTDYLPAGYSYIPVNNPGWAGVAPNPSYLISGPILPGFSETINLELVLVQGNGGEKDWINYAEITSAKNEEGLDRTNWDTDSNPGSDGILERLVEPGDPADNDIESTDKGGEEDDHDPAGTEIYDLALRKTISTPGPFVYGDVVTFNIEVFNQGSIAAEDIEITDYVPCGFQYLPVNDVTGWTFQLSTGYAIYTFDGPLTPGQSAIVNIDLEMVQCDVPSDNAYVNYAEISESMSLDPDYPADDIDSNTDSDPDNDTGGTPNDPNEDDNIDGDSTIGEDEDDHDPASINIYDLALIKELITAGPYAYGDLLEFRVTVCNQGNIDAQNIELTDYLPAGYSFDNGLVGNTGWSESGGDLMYTISGPLVQGSCEEVSLFLTVEQTSGGEKDWINYVEITGSEDTNGNPQLDVDSEEGSNGAGELAVEPGDAADDDMLSNDKGGEEDDHDPAGFELYDLAQRKLVSNPTSYVYGDVVTFTIEVFNQGSVAASGIEITDYIPCGYEYETSNDGQGWSYDAGNGLATITLPGILSPGANTSLTIDLRLVQCIDADVDSYTNYTEISNSQSEDPDQAPDDVDSFTDDDPDNDTGGTPDDPNEDDNVDGDSKQGEDEDDHDPSRIEIFDLALKKELITAGPYTYGDLIEFKVTVCNQGNVDAQNIELTDYLPAGYSFDGGNPANLGWSENADNLEYTINGTLEQDHCTGVNLWLTVEQTSGGEKDWINYVEITGSKDTEGNARQDVDSNEGSNGAGELAVEPGDAADDDMLSTDKGGEEDDHDPAGFELYDLAQRKVIINQLASYEYGDMISFEIEVFNQGSALAENIEITDYIPCGFEYLASNDVFGWNYNVNTGQAKRIISESLAPGSSTVISIDLKLVQCIDADFDSYTNFTEISNSETGDPDVLPVDVDSNTDNDPDNDTGGTAGNPNEDDNIDGDMNEGEDEDDHDPAFVEVFDLALIKELNTAGPYYYGQTLEFEFTVCNQGNIVAQSIQISDYLPIGYSFDSANPANAGWSELGPNLVYTMGGTLNVDACSSVLLYLKLEQTDGGESLWMNYAEITYSEDTEGNQREDADSVEGSDGPGEREVKPGDPADDDLISTEKGGEEDDHDPAGVVEIFDLAQIVTITNEQDFYRYGDDIEFEIFITNQGNISATGIEIIDYVPVGFTYNFIDNPDWTQSNTDTPFTDLDISLEPGESTTISIILKLKASFVPDAYINITEIYQAIGPDGLPRTDIDSEPNGDPYDDAGGEVDTPNDNKLDGNGIDDEDDHDPERPRVFDLAQIKQVQTPGPYQYGDLVTFEFTVVNQGNVNAGNIVVTDSIPAGFTYVPGGINVGWTGVYPEISYTINDVLEEGQSTSFLLQLQLVNTAGGIGNYTNLSEIAAAYDDEGTVALDADSNPDTNFSNDAGGVPDTESDDQLDGNGIDDEDDHDPARINIFDLAARKTSDHPEPFLYQQTVTFDLWVFNQGNKIATEVELTEYIPVGFEYLPQNNGNWTYDPVSRKATLTNRIDQILPGDSALVEIDLKLVQSLQDDAWDNYVEISEAKDVDGNPEDDFDSTPNDDPNDDQGGEPDSDDDDEINEDGKNDPDGDEDDHDPFRPEIFDLALKNVVTDRGPFALGELAEFNFTVYNQGNVTATDIVVGDYLEAGFIWDAGLNPTWIFDGTKATITIPGPLAPGESTTVSVQWEIGLGPNPSPEDWYNWAEILSASDAEENDRSNDDADSQPGSDAAHERAVVPDGTDDNNILGDFRNLGQDEDDHDPDKVIVVGGLGDYVWLDDNYDGVQDDTESPVEGIIALLYDAEGIEIARDTTDSNGFYFFNNLIPGDYKVAMDNNSVPEGMWWTYQDQGGDDALDSDVNFDGEMIYTYINGGEYDSTWDAGLLLLAEVGDFVWHDVDGDGIQDFGEPGIEGVEVILHRSTGSVVETTTTDANGYYLFDDLYPGYYYVEFMTPDDYTDITVDNAGPDDALDSDVNHANGFGTTPTFYLAPGDSNLTLDAGYYYCIPIGDLVWCDWDEDDVWDDNENGVNGLRVNLWKFQNGAWVLYDYIYTGHKPGTPSDDGYWIFCAAPGEYFVEIPIPPYGLVPTIPNVGNDELRDSDFDDSNGMGTTASFTVLSGESKLDIGAGFYNMGVMGDNVWLDDNYNGLQDPGEQGIAGVVVKAYTIDDVMVGEVVTDEEGEFNIENLRKNAHYLKFEPPASYGFTESNYGNNDDIDSDVDNDNGYGTTSLYVINPGDYKDLDAGLTLSSLPIILRTFNGYNAGDFNRIYWTSEREVNASHFEVERRFEEDKAFSAIGVVKATGQSIEAMDYELRDIDIARDGVYYYRLKQVDNDGTFTYSEVISINVDLKADVKVAVYPNPAADYFNLQILSELNESVSLEMYDAAGKLVMSKKLQQPFRNENLLKRFNLDDYAEGNYTLKIKLGDEVFIRKMTKVRL